MVVKVVNILQTQKEGNMKDINNYTDANLEEMVTKITAEGNIAPTQILQTAMNLLMLAERNIHLQNNPENH